MSFTNTGDITISHNLSSTNNAMLFAAGTGIHCSKVGNVILLFNKGNALSALRDMSFRDIKSLTFEGNYDGEDGGAINITSNLESTQSVLRIKNAGEVKFINNRASLRAGAIAAAGVFLSADNGTILFRGNTQGSAASSPSANSTANAISFMALQGTDGASNKSHGILTLRAQIGREITFYDPIVTLITSAKDAQNLATVTLNQSENGIDYDGVIRFDGSAVASYIIKSQVKFETEAAYKKRLDNLTLATLIFKVRLLFGAVA